MEKMTTILTNPRWPRWGGRAKQKIDQSLVQLCETPKPKRIARGQCVAGVQGSPLAAQVHFHELLCCAQITMIKKLVLHKYNHMTIIPHLQLQRNRIKWKFGGSRSSLKSLSGGWKSHMWIRILWIKIFFYSSGTTFFHNSCHRNWRWVRGRNGFMVSSDRSSLCYYMPPTTPGSGGNTLTKNHGQKPKISAENFDWLEVTPIWKLSNSPDELDKATGRLEILIILQQHYILIPLSYRSGRVSDSTCQEVLTLHICSTFRWLSVYF